MRDGRDDRVADLSGERLELLLGEPAEVGRTREAGEEGVGHGRVGTPGCGVGETVRGPPNVTRRAGAECIPSRQDGLLPDRDVLAALARERLAPPAAPALPEAEAGHLRHEVELGRPDVAERPRAVVDPTVDDREVVRDQALVRDVVLVDPPVALADVEDDGRRALRQPAQVRASGTRSRSSRPARGAARRSGMPRPARPASSGSRSCCRRGRRARTRPRRPSSSSPRSPPRSPRRRAWPGAGRPSAAKGRCPPPGRPAQRAAARSGRSRSRTRARARPRRAPRGSRPSRR